MDIPNICVVFTNLVRVEKPHFEARIDIRDLYKVFVVEPEQLSERLRAQSGAFLLSAFHERFEPANIVQWNDGTPIYAHYPLTVTRDCKGIIQEELRLLNITHETLLPGLDSSASVINDLFRQHGG